MEHIERPSTPSFLHGVQKYPPSGRQLGLCADDVAAVQDVSVRMRVSVSAF